MARKRKLSTEEKALWQKVARSVRPLSAERFRKLQGEETKQPTAAGKRPGEKVATKQPVQTMSIKHRPIPTVRPSNKPRPMPVNRGGEKKLRKGGVSIDARIDLHGMYQTEALATLTRFLVEADARGHRTVLVITGKGTQLEKGGLTLAPWERRESPGVLKRKLPEWLGYPQLSQLVSGYAQSHAKHGGEGAYYVTLRRKKPPTE
jgi:DNA-nicking Smr family endonuclease